MKSSPAEAFEARFVRPRAGRTLVVGSYVVEGKPDRRANYADAIGIDMREGPGVDFVLNLEDDLPGELGRFAHVECWSVLEHSRRPWLLAANIERLMEPGATLHLTVPFVWRIHSYPSDYFRFTAEGVRSLFPGIEWEELMYASNRLKDHTYLNAVQIEDYPYMPRAEVVGFGRRA